MEEKVTGLYPEFIIHPGETLLEIMDNCGMTKSELAIRCGVSSTHIANVLKGTKDISVSFSKKLEYVFDIDASFWINLQANYDREIMEYQETYKIADEEKEIVNHNLKQITDYLKCAGMISDCRDSISKVMEMRKFLNISNLTVIPRLSRTGAYRVATNVNIDIYVIYAWQCLCEAYANRVSLEKPLNVALLKESIIEIKSLMFLPIQEAIEKLKVIFQKCGISFCVVKNFSKAPVQGYIKKIGENNVMLCLTIRQSYADIFWFTLFHEIAHIINEDYKNVLIDYDFTKDEIEERADQFSRNTLIPESIYNNFISNGDFSLQAINSLAQNCMIKPYIIIGRLQKEKMIEYYKYSEYKTRLKWAEK